MLTERFNPSSRVFFSRGEVNFFERLFEHNTCLNHIQNDFDVGNAFGFGSNHLENEFMWCCVGVGLFVSEIDHFHIKSGLVKLPIQPVTLSIFCCGSGSGNVTAISTENTSPIGQLSKIYQVFASDIDLFACIHLSVSIFWWEFVLMLYSCVSNFFPSMLFHSSLHGESDSHIPASHIPNREATIFAF